MKREERAFDHLDIALVTETYPPEVNGVARSLHHLAREIAGAGHAVRVVRPRQREEAGADDLRIDGVTEHLVPGVPLPRYAGLQCGVPCGPTLRAWWSASPPDLVHVATEGPLGMSAIRAARSLGIPVTSSFHTQFHAYGRHYGLGPLHRIGLAYLRWLHHGTRRTYVPSSTALELLRVAGFRDLAVLGRGVDTDLFRPDRRDPELRRAWGASDDTPVLLHVGRLAAEKNLDVVLRTAEAVRADRPGTILVLVGDGPMRAHLERRAPWARFAGARHGEDLARHYASGDLFLFPSTTETFGNVVTEALASGLLVLGYDYAATREHVESGVNGIAVPFDRTSAFIHAARVWMSFVDIWPEIRARARETAIGLTWSAVAAAWLEDLRAVLRESGAPSPVRALERVS